VKKDAEQAELEPSLGLLDATAISVGALEYALLLAAGSILGTQVVAYTSKRISGKNLRRIFAAILIIVGVKMLLDNCMVLGF